jgi:hypothetical protein
MLLSAELRCLNLASWKQNMPRLCTIPLLWDRITERFLTGNQIASNALNNKYESVLCYFTFLIALDIHIHSFQFRFPAQQSSLRCCLYSGFTKEWMTSCAGQVNYTSGSQSALYHPLEGRRIIWSVVRGKGAAGTLEVGPSESAVRLFTIEVTFRPDIGKLVSLHQAHSSHWEFSNGQIVTIPVQGVLPTVYMITNLKKRPGPNQGLYSHWWMNERMNEWINEWSSY